MGRVECSPRVFIDNRPEGFATLTATLQKHRQGEKVALIFEATCGAPINALVEFEWLQLCPVNPVKTKMLNQIDGSAKGKSDPRDSHLLCDYLMLAADTLLQTHLETDTTVRQLRERIGLERDLIAQVTALKQRIQAEINAFAPALNELLDDLEKPLLLNTASLIHSGQLHFNYRLLNGLVDGQDVA